MKKLFENYKQAIPLSIYGIIYLVWWTLIEQMNTTEVQIIHMKVDDIIPFCEIFIIPYFMWFVYVIGVLVLLYRDNKSDYHKNSIFLMIGMTVFLLISTFFPNGQQLRPEVMPRDNILTGIVSFLYSIDTPTNIWPSIHVYNSIAAHLGVALNKNLRNNKWIYGSSLVLCISISLATVFLKQHSIFDVITAIILAIIVYIPVYKLRK